jgi:hypothetical protein
MNKGGQNETYQITERPGPPAPMNPLPPVESVYDKRKKDEAEVEFERWKYYFDLVLPGVASRPRDGYCSNAADYVTEAIALADCASEVIARKAKEAGR